MDESESVGKCAAGGDSDGGCGLSGDCESVVVGLADDGWGWGSGEGVVAGLDDGHRAAAVVGDVGVLPVGGA